MKYKVGQTVKIVKSTFDDDRVRYIGTEHVIEKVDDKNYYFNDTPVLGINGRYLWNDDEVVLVSSTPSRYTGELREGMRVMMVRIKDGSQEENTIVKWFDRWNAISSPGCYWHDDFIRQPDNSWSNGFAYISHVISEPEEEQEPKKDPGGFWTGISVDVDPNCPKDTIYYFNNEREAFSFNISPCKGVLNTIMNSIKTIPNKVKRFLNDSYKRFYKLGWIDEGLNLTSEGSNALEEFLLSKFEKEFGEYAGKELRALKKQLKSGKGKKDETDDDE